MRYIGAIQGTTFFFVVFALMAWLIPGQGDSDQVQLILTVSTFLFAILAGFFIARLNQRYDMVQELLAEEDAHWLTFYKTAAFFDNGFRAKLADLLDEYYVRAFDSDTLYFYKQTAPTFLKIYDAFAQAKVVDPDRNALEPMIDILMQLEERRNKISVRALEKVRLGQWTMLFILAAIILFSLYYLKDQTWVSVASTVLLSTALVLVLLTMRDLQNFRLGGELIAVESGQELFEFIGRPRYYNERYVKSGAVRIPREVTQYRLGRHEPGSKELRLELQHVARDKR